jgi:glycosyltransferase involved in cell wall biosynthesis|nr:glycosyltransferase family 2 protein [uncultured Acetatifactor sp.]
MDCNFLVSIIIPVYNVERYLVECLDSVLKQTYNNIEVICVDDASTDNSLSILEKYASQDKRLQVIRKEENVGLASARNAGFDIAIGKYVYYLDSDDYIDLNAIELLYSYAEKYNTDCVYFNSRLISEAETFGKGPKLSYGLGDADKKVFDGVTLFKLLNENRIYTNSVWRQFWRRNYLIDNKLRFVDGMRTSEDAPFSIRAMLSGQKMMIVDEVYHTYRRRKGAITTESTLIKLIDMFKGYCIILDYWKSNQFDRTMNGILNERLKQMLVNVKRIYMKVKRECSKEYFDGIEQHLFETLVIQEYEHSLNMIDEDKLKKIREFLYVIVYGAYLYAAEVVEKLERKGIRIASLAVTQMHEKAEGIGGIPIHEIKDLCHMKDDAIVVLGIGKRNQPDVIRTLDKYGFTNYISLD